MDGSNPSCVRVGCGCFGVQSLGAFVWSVVLVQLLPVAVSPACSFFNAADGCWFNAGSKFAVSLPGFGLGWNKLSAQGGKACKLVSLLALGLG